MKACVYRAFDAAGRLLYIGYTGNLGHRLKAHVRTPQRWWAIHTSMTFEWFDTPREANIAERLAILSEYPIFNINDRAYDHPLGWFSCLHQVVYPPHARSA